jgi:hypothetical protein
VNRVYSGVRPNDFHPTTILPHGKVGATSASGTFDARQFVQLYVDLQIGQCCVGESTDAMNWLASGGTGKRGSHRGIYTGARVRERARKTDPIPDTGCQATDAYGSIVECGIYPMDARDDDPAALNEMDTWGEEAGFVPVPMSYLTALSDGDTDSLTNYVLTSKAGGPYVGATYTQAVDAGYEGLDASNPMWEGMKGPSLGFHRQGIVGVVQHQGTLCFVVWNSWGTGWGDGGFSYIPVPVFRANASSVVVHLNGVIL